VNSRTYYVLLQAQCALHTGFYVPNPEKVLMTSGSSVHTVLGHTY
jgi:hypothetical protein